MSEALQTEVLRRLDGEGLSDEVNNLVYAAVLGELDEYLAGGRAPRPAFAQSTPPADPVGAYLDGIVVQGFRGIGDRAELPLTPGPGLTLVVGRNGSGKSSFAEGVEVLLTGDNQRWSSRRGKVWKDGWRNLHQSKTARIDVGLVIEGRQGRHVASRAWEPGAGFDVSQAEVKHGGERESLHALGWAQPLATYRPFLSYNELGSMLEEGPSKLSDALGSILGLEELVAAADALKDARTQRSQVHKRVKDRHKHLRVLLEAHEDPRAATCAKALKGTKWKLGEVRALLHSESAESDGSVALLRQACELSGPRIGDIEQAIGALRNALMTLRDLGNTEAARAQRHAEVLEHSLELHEAEGDGDCPVCGSDTALNPDWRAKAQRLADELRKDAATAIHARQQVATAQRTLRQQLRPPPPWLGRLDDVGLDAARVRTAWDAWAAGAAHSGSVLATHAEGAILELCAAIDDLRATAKAALAAREDAWHPLANQLAEWLPGAARLLEEGALVSDLKKAEDWIRDTTRALQNERFDPIKQQVKGIWELLRSHSNVQIENITFEGRTSSRRINLDVTVDGTQGAALGVMSQGELHSLALALFLPRATLPASPFRFLVIDDPVQSMDPARVEGLASVLGEVAKARQVIVFTHDDRLPEAVRRLGMAATFIQVKRRERSAVDVEETASPFRQYLEDAFALVKTDGVPPAVIRQVVPGLCRQALEAVCMEVVRRRRLARGEAHESVEALFPADGRKLLPLLALALHDDASAAGKVYATIENRAGSAAVEAIKGCNKGAHLGLLEGDPLAFARSIERLAEKLATLQ